MSKTFKDKFNALKAKLKKSEANEQSVAEISKLQSNLENALSALPNELEDNLVKRVKRFFKQSQAYQEKHLERFVEGLVVAVDNYVVPAQVVENEAKDYSQIKNDVLANIALALASLLIFYPVVLAVNSYYKGQNYGFFRWNDGRNEINEVDGITMDQHYRNDVISEINSANYPEIVRVDDNVSQPD